MLVRRHFFFVTIWLTSTGRDFRSSASLFGSSTGLSRVFLPKVHVVLHRHGVTSEYYAMQWFLTLFASDLPQPTVRRIWDRFLVAGWTVIAQVGLALLYEVQDTLVGMDTCEALTFLKRLTKKGRFQTEALLAKAAAFEVSHRMLSELEAAYATGTSAAFCSAVASRAIVEETAGVNGDEASQGSPLPKAQLDVAKDLQSGRVSWQVHRSSAAADASAAGPTAQLERHCDAESARSVPTFRGDGTMLPFLFHNLDTGETSVLQQEWDEYLRERTSEAAPGAPRPPAAAAGGAAFWLEGIQQQALQALHGRSPSPPSPFR